MERLHQSLSDMNQVRSEFDLKISDDQFCEIRHISQPYTGKN
jgi:hypothetical protein